MQQLIINLATNYGYQYDFDNLKVTTYAFDPGVPDQGLAGVKMSDAKIGAGSILYSKIKNEVGKQYVVLPPSSAMAGVYTIVDNNKGVWKAPANESISSVVRPYIDISSREQENLNVDPSAGKSINVIRSFPGYGVLIWGARTLNGNDNEWRYISVRRFFNMVEESIKKSIQWAVFEPNTIDTWIRVRGMIENYLSLKWREGALAGAKPEQAYYVKVGLPATMTSLDVLEGRMIVEIGMAVARPAEFIVLKFIQLMQQS
jgi:phage tail sheath protein FI